MSHAIHLESSFTFSEQNTMSTHYLSARIWALVYSVIWFDLIKGGMLFVYKHIDMYMRVVPECRRLSK